MKICVENCSGELQVILRGPAEGEELLRIMALLRGIDRKLWGRDEKHDTIAIAPGEIVWAETVENKVFVYTKDTFYQIALSLGELESRWEGQGLFRCAKSAVINLNAVCRLRSCMGGRIEAEMNTGERVMISRRYAPLLREKLQERGKER